MCFQKGCISTFSFTACSTYTSTLPYLVHDETCYRLRDNGYDVQDFGTNSTESVDYPDYVHPLASAVERGEFERGILLCGSANGVCITANKHQGIRAGLAWEPEVASLIRRHNNANVVCIPARFVDAETARAITSQFLNTAFEGGRHQTRIDKISC